MLRKEFRRKNYHFHYITTDGVGATILFRHDRFLSGYVPKKVTVNKCGKPKTSIDDTPYLRDINSSIYYYHNKVAIDPNKMDVLYCTDGRLDPKNNKKVNTFRYTKSQIDFETKRKRYEEVRNIAKDKSGISLIESKLSDVNPKSTKYDIFRTYVEIKVGTFSEELLSHYRYNRKFDEKVDNSKASYMKIKMNVKINTERSEAKMLNKFEEKFGNKDEAIVCFGDYAQGHLRGTAPVKGKGLRKVFKKRGYKVFLISEHKTSKICHNCHGELEKFHRKGDRKKKKTDYKVRTYSETIGYVHVVLRVLWHPGNNQRRLKRLLIIPPV